MDRDSLRTRGLRLAPVAWAAILPLLMLGPALGKGYVLSYDMVWVPDLSLRTDFLGLGTALPRAVPSDAIVAVLDELVPGMLLQKLVLYGGLVLAGLGYARMVRPAIVPRMVAVSLAIWNPFVVERLWIGHWPVLLGYAAVPWLVLAGRRIRLEHRIPISVWFLLPLGSLSASAGLVSALVVMVSALGRRPDMVAARLMAGCLAVNAPWWVAGLLHADDALGSTGAQVFGLRGEGSLPAPLSALGLGGIWNSEVVPPSQKGVLAWAALTGLLVLAALGARSWWRREPELRLVALWAVGFLLALVSWMFPDALAWVGEHVPGGGILRDGTRSLALCLPLLVTLVSEGAEVVLARATAAAPRLALAVGCVLLPLAVMTDAAWGIAGELRPTDYPASYPAARAALADAKGDLVVLPFSSYRAPEWNGGRKVLDPLGRYLEPNYVVNDELSISGRIVAGEDPRVPEVLAALRLADPEDRATALGRLGVRLVARERDAVGAGDPPYDAEVAGTRVYGDRLIEITRIDSGVEPRVASTTSTILTGLAWTALLFMLMVGIVRVARRLVLQMATREETTARVPR